MNLDISEFDCVNIVELSFCDNGRSLKFELIESVPPHATYVVIARNSFSVQLSHAPGDEYPFFVPEFRWRTLGKEENVRELVRCNYGFNGAQMTPIVADRSLVQLKLEGAISGTVIAESIEWD